MPCGSIHMSTCYYHTLKVTAVFPQIIALFRVSLSKHNLHVISWKKVRLLQLCSDYDYTGSNVAHLEIPKVMDAIIRGNMPRNVVLKSIGEYYNFIHIL